MSNRIIYVSRNCPHCKKLLIGMRYLSDRNKQNIVILKQADLLLNRYREIIDFKYTSIIEKFLLISKYPSYLKGIMLFLNGFSKNGLTRKIIDIINPI